MVGGRYSAILEYCAVRPGSQIHLYKKELTGLVENMDSTPTPHSSIRSIRIAKQDGETKVGSGYKGEIKCGTAS